MYYLLGAQPRSPNRLPPRPGDVQLCQKNDGPAVLTRTRNTSNVRSTTQRGIGNTNRLCRIHIQHLDQRQHLGSNRLDVLQTGHPNEQRRGRLHNGLNRRASGRAQLPMYLLIQLLYREAKLTVIQIHLVSERKLRRIQRRKYRELQQRIFELWDQCEAGERSARRLLKACSYLNGPVEL